MTEKKPLPFSTPTIARLYMLQGKLDQAETIYRALQAESPEDPRLSEGLAEVQRRRQSASSGAAEGLDCAVELHQGAESGPLECRYQVSEAGRRRASLVLGASGALTLRVCAFPAGKQEDIPLLAASGAVVVPPSLQGAVIAAAVGLCDESGRFVAISHSSLGPR